MATRTIANGGGNWSVAGTWVEGAAPTASDAVVATATSGQVTVNTTACVCASADFTNYTNTITFTAGQILTVSGNVKFVAGMAIAGTGTLQINAASSMTSGGLTFPGSLSFNAAVTRTLVDNWTVTGNLTVSVGNAALNGNTLYLGGGITLTGFGMSGTTAIVLNGTGTLSCSVSTVGVNNNLTINTAGTITIDTNFGYNTGILTYTAGTIVNTGSTLNIRGNCTLNTSGMNWNNVSVATASTAITLSSALNLQGLLTLTVATTFSGNYLITCAGLTCNGAVTHTLSGNIDCNGAMTVNTGAAIINGAGKNIYVSGNLTLTGFGVSGTASIILDGTGTWSCSTAAIGVANNLEMNTAGTITLGTNLGYITGTLTYTAGTIINTSNTLNILGVCTLNTFGMNWNNIVAGAASTITLASDLNLVGTLDLSSYDLMFAGNYNISCNTLHMDKSRTLSLVSGRTLTVTLGFSINGATDGLANIVSGTPTVAAYLVYQGTVDNQKIFAANFTDINSSGSSMTINNYFGTVTRCVNISTLYDVTVGTLVWAAANRTLTDKSGYALTGVYDPAKSAASQASVNAIPTNPLLTNDARLNNLDAAVSSRSTLTATDVWNYAARTLTSFGTLVSDVWSAVARTLTGAVSINSNADITAIKAKTDNLPADTNAVLKIVQALCGKNSRMFNASYDSDHNLLSATIRGYASKTDLEVDTNPVVELTVAAIYSGPGQATEHVMKES